MVIGLAALAVAAAQAESVALVFIALTADAVARGESRLSYEIGPVDLGPTVSIAGVVTLVAIVVAACFAFTFGRLASRKHAQLERMTRDEIVSSYAEADWEYQSTQKSSRMQGRLRLMDARSRAFTGLVGWTRAVCTVAVFVTAATVMSPQAAVVIVVFGAILSVVVLPIRKRAFRIARGLATEELGLSEDVGEAMDHGPDVQVFGAWPAFARRFGVRSGALETLRARSGMVKFLQPTVYQYGALFLIALILFAASATAATGQVGQFAASAILLLRSIQYGQQLQTSLHVIAESIPRIEELSQELVVPPPRVTPGTAILSSIEQLELRHATYRYPETTLEALSDVSISLRPGVIVGVAGPSGAGKSTLAQILLRLRWPTSGQYMINGQQVDEYSVSSWNKVVAHVPQQPRLLHGSLAENVSFFDESIPSDAIEEALRAVGMWDLTAKLPHGVDTFVGPTGRNLSGGQIQRIGIARALVRSPKLVVLDEPTSALDANAERIVGEALTALRMRPDVLVVVIAHRPSTLALCDELLVVRDGRVEVSGPGTDLAATSIDGLAPSSDLELNSAESGRL
jgi:ABC-type multidrug transport system fused ATPase/permease subunit